MNRYKVDMVNGPLFKNILLFSIPLMATNLLQMLFNATDTIIVGKFAGEKALAAVGATGSLIFLMTSLFNGLGIGANVIIAKALGANDKVKLKKAVHTSIFIGIYGGLALVFLGIFSTKTLLTLMSTPASIITQSTLYMQIVFIGSPFMIVYNFASAILRSKGDTQRPMLFLFISGVVNVFLNLFFVAILKIDVKGVAIATVISQFISCLLIVLTLVKADDELKLNLEDIKCDKKIAFELLKIGIPAGLQGMAFSLSNVVIQSSINSFDSSIIVAGNSAASNIENFVYIGMMAFTQATMTFTSQNLGANNINNIKKIMLITLFLNGLSALLVGFIAWYFGPFFLSLFVDDPLVIEVGMIRLFWVALLLVFNGILDVFINSMRGMGYSNLPTFIMIIGVCGLRLAWIYFYFPLNRSLDVIYMCYSISWILTDIFEIWLWFRIYHKLKLKLTCNLNN